MAIESVTYHEGFRLKMQWSVGVQGSIIYSVPRGSGLADGDALMSAFRSNGLQRFNGFSYGSGTQSVSYAPHRADMQACWVDICYCDYNSNFEVMRHECVGTYFNGICKVAQKIELIPISADRRAVQITVQNRSKFRIEAGGIGYSVNNRVYGIPRALEKNQTIILPQFDVSVDDDVKLCRMEGSYPAEFYTIDE